MQQRVFTAKPSRRRVSAIVVAASISVLAIAGCGSSSGGSSNASSSGSSSGSSSAPGTLGQLRSAGAIKGGVISNPPFSDVTSQGTFSGIAPDLAAAIFQKLNVPKINAVPATYANVIPGLDAKHWDFVDSALDITPERCKQVLFSDPISVVPMVALVKKGQASSVTSVKDAVAKHMKFAEIEGGTGIDTVEAAGMPKSDIQSYPNLAARAAAMNAGRADFTISSYTSVGADLKTLGSNWEATGPLPDAPIEVSAFAFRKSDGALRDAVNAQLKTMRENGEYDTLAKKYGFPTSTENKTTAGMCSGS
jgi:polar amino acid transport system substrate-binding protein